MTLPAGLYRTTQAHPFEPEQVPGNSLVYVGDDKNAGGQFVVRPGRNVHNRWYWGDPTTPLTDPLWERTLKRLPSEGFYTLPEDLRVGDAGMWRKNAVIQLGYNPNGEGIIFVAERHEGLEVNALFFSERGIKIPDDLLFRLNWAPILPISPQLNA
jgi:hypothetical protein